MMKIKKQQVTLSRKQKFPVLTLKQVKKSHQDVLGLMIVTVAIARELLKNNNNYNRPIRRSKDYLEVLNHMIAGTFYNHTDLIFDPEGELLNGQHRLTAIVESGKPQVFTIKVGFNREQTLCHTDTNSKRTDANQTKFLVQENSHYVKADLTAGEWKNVNFARNWKHFLTVTDVNMAGSQINSSRKNTSNKELKKFLIKEHKTIIEVSKLLSPSVRWSFAAPLMNMWKKDPEKARDFLNKFVCANQPLTCPTTRVHELLNQTDGHKKQKQSTLVCYIHACMNAFLKGKRIRYVENLFKTEVTFEN
jgi:hypothetical protein